MAFTALNRPLDNTETPMTFGEYIRDRRIALGWTQPEAAAKARIEQSYLSKLENARSTPSAEVYTRLCEAYEIDSAALYAAIDDDAVQDLMEVEQIRAIAALRASQARSETTLWRVAGVIAFGLGGALLGAAQIAPVEESRFVYQSTGVIFEGEPLDLFADLEAAPAQISDRIEELTLSQIDYRGPSFIEPAEDGRRVWRLVGGETVTVRGWARWLAIPALMFLFAGAASFVVLTLQSTLPFNAQIRP